MLHFHPISTKHARAYQSGNLDAYSQPPEHTTSTGPGNPCRHCLEFIPQDAAMLILAYRPFPEPQPYAETGPIFLCARQCQAFSDIKTLPPVLHTSPTYLLRGYNADDRISYGTGRVVAQAHLESACRDILASETVSYVHVRSATNNCFQCRVALA